MTALNTCVKHAGGLRLSLLSSAAAAPRPAVLAPRFSRAFVSDNSSQKDGIPRTATGEVQKQNNFASEVGKKMQEAATGDNSADPKSNGKGESPNQERSKGGFK